MHCRKCNTLNVDGVNFCYNCGEKFTSRKNKYSLINFTYKNIIFSKNKHRNIFILLSILVLSSALSVPLCKGLVESFNIAISLVDMSTTQEIAKHALKSQTELYFRDTFLRGVLIVVSWSLLLFDVVVLILSYALNKQQSKNKNIC